MRRSRHRRRETSDEDGDTFGVAEQSAEVLHETEEALVVVPQVTDNVFFAGVNILDKRSIRIGR